MLANKQNYIFRCPYHLMHAWRMLGYGITNPSGAAIYPRGDSTRLCRESYLLLKDGKHR